MRVYGIHLIDHAVILAYLIGITCLGLWMARSVRNLEDFFQGGRRFGRVFMTMFAFGAGTHSDQAVGVISKTYTNGLSGIWYQWLWLFATPFYWLIAPIFRRMRALTTSDYFELRFGPGLAVLFSLVSSLIGMVNMGTMLLGSGKILEACTGHELPLVYAIGSMTVLFVLYGVAGGLVATVMTDFVQGLLTIVLSILILPFALQSVGGFSGLHEKIRDPHMFSLVAPSEINLFYVAMLSINSLFTIGGQAMTQAICGASKSEYDSRVGFCYGNFLKRLCTIAWCFTGLCTVALYPGLADPDMAFGKAAYDLLPAVMPGLLGLLIASVLASVMDNCAVLMNSSAALLTVNVYKRHWAPARSEPHYLIFGRAVSCLTVVGGIAAAFYLESVIAGLEFFWQVGAMLGIPFWMGVFWRRATNAGAWAATLVSIATGYLLTRADVAEWLYPLAEFAVRFDPKKELFTVELPWRMLAYLTTGIAAGVWISLLTPRHDTARLDRFYNLLRTPIRPGEVILAPCTLPEGVTPANPPKLLGHPDLEIYRPTRTDTVGFLVACLVVVIIVMSVWMLARVGG
ncbi:MAG: sodium:solute symporter family protein [Candidatus Omnitrophica bacterium]|nr:sodium:solute symporter family protein [Candidatus Omnitrophota bacterium]